MLINDRCLNLREEKSKGCNIGMCRFEFTNNRVVMATMDSEDHEKGH
jgi:hypothetical protein